MSADNHGWLVVLAEVEGLRWVLEKSRMAWTEASAGRASGIHAGDRRVLYVARGAFHDPTRDESQLVGLARVANTARRLRCPVKLARRRFVCRCDLRFELVLPEGAGVPVPRLVDRLSFVKRKDVWGECFRSALVQVPPDDLDLMAAAIHHHAA